MEIILKIYDDIFSSTTDILIDDIIDISIKHTLDTSKMNLKLINSFTGLKRMQKIEAYEVANNTDTLVFEGYIDSIIPSIDDLTLVCKNMKSIFLEQIVLTDKSYTTQTVDFIINDLLSEWNTAYSESWTYSNTLTGTYSKDFKAGDKLYNVIDELSWLAGWIWTVKNNKVIITDLIWEDKSIGANFTEIVFNKLEPSENNVVDIAIDNYATTKNVIMWSDWTTKTTLDSISGEKALAEFKKFRVWDLTNQTQAYLDSKKFAQFMYRIKIQLFTIKVNIWDKLYLRIENVSDYLNYSWNVIVNKLDITYKNWTRLEEIWVSSWYVYIDSFSNKINNLNDKINILNI